MHASPAARGSRRSTATITQSAAAATTTNPAIGPTTSPVVNSMPARRCNSVAAAIVGPRKTTMPRSEKVTRYPIAARRRNGLAVLRQTRLRDLRADYETLQRTLLEQLVQSFRGAHQGA